MKQEEYNIVSNNIVSINRNDCPKNCNFKNREDLPIVLIPPPRTRGVLLISRAPTEDFCPIYEFSRCYNQDERRHILFASATPYSLIVSIKRFLEKDEKKMDKLKENIMILFKIFEVAYWTHFHKCPTNQKKFTERCANKWLREEIKEIIEIRDQIKAIVCLGENARNWMSNNEDTLKGKNIKIIHLPLPSMGWNIIKDQERQYVKTDIEKLIQILKEL